MSLQSVFFKFRVLSVVEDYLENAAINPGENVTQNEQNIAVYSQDVNQSTFQGAGAESLLISMGKDEEHDFVVYDNDLSVQPMMSQISLTMPKSLFENLNIDSTAQNERILFVIYRETSLFQTQVKKTRGRKTTNKLNTWVISGSVKGVKLTSLQESIVTTYQPLEKAIHEKPACVFWDFSLKNGIGGWSQSGCNHSAKNGTVIFCRCSHLTNFAVLMVRN